MKPSPDQLLQLLQQTFGATVELVDYTTGNQLDDYLVLLVQLRHPAMKVVIKIAGPEAPYACPFDRTARLHPLVAARTSIPMPGILAVDTSYRSWPWRYLIKAFIPGQEWMALRPRMNSEELSSAYQQIGRAVAELHSIQFPAFGELAVDGTVEGDGPFLAALTERVRRSIQNPRLQELFFSALDKRRDLFLDINQPCLCHEDLHGHNILFDFRDGQWQLATILDFDKAWAGHAEIDLARLEIWRGMTSKEFWEAYTAIHTIDPGYEQRRPIYQLLWCLEFARATPEHLADTHRLCAELGLPILVDFE